MGPEPFLTGKTDLIEGDDSLRHVQAELARLDQRLARAVRRWKQAGQDPEDVFLGLYISDAQADALLRRPLAVSWGQSVELPAEEEQAFLKAEAAAQQRIQQVAAQAREKGADLRLARLAAEFGLDRFDLDALLICLAPALDLRYERLYGYLQDDVTRRRPTTNLILDLLAEPGLSRLRWLDRFTGDASLIRHRLLERLPPVGADSASLLGQALAIDETTAAWLLGSYRPGRELAGCARLEAAGPSEEDRLLAGAAFAELEGGLAARPVLAFTGVDGAAQDAAARLAAAWVDRPVLHVDLNRLVSGGADGRQPDTAQAAALALRDARLTGAVPYLSGWDACAEGCLQDARLQALLFEYPGLVVVAGREPWEPAGFARTRPLLRAAFPMPGYGQRRDLLQRALEGRGEAVQEAVESLAASYQLTSAQIRDVAASALDRAEQRGGRLEIGDVFAAARAHSSPRLSELARKIEPRHDWNDIILPDDQLSQLGEITATMRGRARVLDEWGVARKLASSRGVTVLFSGPPGTGKTMAAEIIAGTLGLDLYKIDLSGVVSKYIGETEKNLSRLFAEAESSNAILFFDEADALFGKRSEVRDAHDRYANVEISYLLQRMEAYNGLTVLATNLRANLDEAFTRRLHFAVDFPFPDEADRLRIWQALFPPGVPRSPDLDLPLLARRYRLAGGSIRNVLVSAAYLAAADGGVVTMDHLLHGTRRELQKMGKLIES